MNYFSDYDFRSCVNGYGITNLLVWIEEPSGWRKGWSKVAQAAIRGGVAGGTRQDWSAAHWTTDILIRLLTSCPEGPMLDDLRARAEGRPSSSLGWLLP